MARFVCKKKGTMNFNFISAYFLSDPARTLLKYSAYLLCINAIRYNPLLAWILANRIRPYPSVYIDKKHLKTVT